jgi:putative ABC transport system permease protein
MITQFITTLGVFIAALMALGALFGALNTMYSAVAARTREIATLRALGFGSTPLIISVLSESIALALFGGAFGAAVSYMVFNGFTATTMNFQTFSQVTFRLRRDAAPAHAGDNLGGRSRSSWGNIAGHSRGCLPIAQGLRES